VESAIWAICEKAICEKWIDDHSSVRDFLRSALGISNTLLSTAHEKLIAADHSGCFGHPSDILDFAVPVFRTAF
jgi:hypothetical protein